MDYKKYCWRPRELLLYLSLYFLVSVLAAFLFFNHPLGLGLAALIVPVGLRTTKKQFRKRQQQELTIQFKDCMRFVAGALAAGYAMENAWQSAQVDLDKMYEPNAMMCLELKDINARLALNEPIEKLLLEFAWRSGVEDVLDFAQIFTFAKRGGGDFRTIIGSTVKKISDKAEIMQEIETTIAAKRLEQKLMNMIPLLLLLYIRISAPDFINPLYGNLLGIAIMSGCLLLYGFAMLLAEKIVEIEV